MKKKILIGVFLILVTVSVLSGCEEKETEGQSIVYDFSKIPMYHCNGTIIEVFLEDFYYGYYTEHAHKHTVVVLENATETMIIPTDNNKSLRIEDDVDQLIFDSSDYGILYKLIGENVYLRYRDQTVILYYDLIKVETRVI